MLPGTAHWVVQLRLIRLSQLVLLMQIVVMFQHAIPIMIIHLRMMLVTRYS